MVPFRGTIAEHEMHTGYEPVPGSRLLHIAHTLKRRQRFFVSDCASARRPSAKAIKPRNHVARAAAY